MSVGTFAAHFAYFYSANIVALVIPNEDEIGANSELEVFYANQVYQMTKQKTNSAIGRKIPDDPPNEVALAMSNYLKEQHKDLMFEFHLTATPLSDPDTFQQRQLLRYFQPFVLNQVARSLHARARHQGENNMEGFGACFENKDPDRQVQVIFDMILLDEDIWDDADEGGQRFAKETHLSPLESSLDQSIRSAEMVLREMKFMEKREARMRQTSESINMRVRWFSYLSISVLLSVTYVQVTYLKRYFHKKKLM